MTYAVQNERQQRAHAEPRQRISYSGHREDLPESPPTEYKHRTAESKETGTWAEGKQRRMRTLLRPQRDREAFSEPAAGYVDHSIAF